MDKKKVIIAIVLFVFLGLMVFTFAQTPDDEVEGNGIADSGNGSNVVTTTKVADSEANNEAESNNTRQNNTTRTTTATRNSETTTTTTAVATTTRVVLADNDENNSSQEEENQGMGNSGALPDETVPTIIINGETLNEDIEEIAFATINEFIVNDNNDTVIRVNGDEVKADDLLALLSVDGEYVIEVSDGVNTRKIKLLIDTTAPKATRVEILNDTENENTSYANFGDTLRVLVYFDEELIVLPELTIIGDRTVTLRKSGALTKPENSEYVYYYDYIIRKELAQGEIEFLISGYEDSLKNKGEDITETLNASYPGVIYDSVAPTFVFENTSGGMVASRIVKLIASEAILAPEGWTEVEDSNGKEWTKTFTSNTKIKNFVVTDLAGNVSDGQLLDVKNVDSSVPTGSVSYSIEKPTNGDVVVTLTTSTDCLTPSGWTKVNWRKFTKVYSENGKETVRLTSRTGIEGEEDISVEVSNIDRIPATVTYSVHSSQVRIKADEKITLNVSGWTKKNDGKEWRKTLEAGRNYEITATDEAGNTTTIIIDRILPTLTYSIHGKQVRIKADEKVTLNVKGWNDYKGDGTEWRKTLEAGKKYEITATDEVGNSSIIFIEMKNDSKITLTAPSVLEYDGTEKSVTAILTKGENYENIDVTYYQGDVKLDAAPVDAGTYTAVAEFAGDDYYYGSSASLEFSITQAQVTVSLDLPENMTYDGTAKDIKFKFINASGSEVTGILNVPTIVAKPNNGFGWYTEFVNAGTYTVWSLHFNTSETDNYRLINLTNDSYYGSFTIAKATANIELVGPNDFVYDGNPKNYTVKESEISEFVSLTYYEITLNGEVKLDAAPVNVGNYKVVAEFAGNNNYESAETVSEEFTIEKLKVSLTLSFPENMTYDGTAKDIKVIFTAEDGKEVTGIDYSIVAAYSYLDYYKWVTEFVDAGKYQAWITVNNESSNYEFTNLNGNLYTENFEILKGQASIELEAPKSLVYTGKTKEFNVKSSDISEFVSLTYYEITSNGEVKLDAAPVNVGNYKVVAEFAGNEYYNAVGKVEIEFSITKANVIMSITEKDNFIYTGAEKKLQFTFTNEDNENVEGISATYSKLAFGGELIEAGTYTVKLNVSPIETTNYIISNYETWYTITILPAE